MKKNLVYILVLFTLSTASNTLSAQQIKVGVFDIELMVQALPAYRQVDSLVQVYEKDSLSAEYEIYQSEYIRLDSTYKKDSALVAEGKKTKKMLDYTAGERQKMGMNLVYWQQLAQNKSGQKRNELARPLFTEVATAYKKVLDRSKYNIVLKPQTYELGFRIENIFISVAKELKLTSLPQELLALGEDPDAGVAAPATKPKPKTK